MHCTGGGFNFSFWHKLTCIRILSESSRLVVRYIRALDSFYTRIHCKNYMHKLPVKGLGTSHSTALFYMIKSVDTIREHLWRVKVLNKTPSKL